MDMSIETGRTYKQISDLSGGAFFLIPEKVQNLYLLIGDTFKDEDRKYQILRINDSGADPIVGGEFSNYKITLFEVPEKLEDSPFDNLAGNLEVEVVKVDMEVFPFEESDFPS